MLTPEQRYKQGPGDIVFKRLWTLQKQAEGTEEARAFDAVLSSEAPDRVGDIIRVAGWDLTNFVRNPVMLFGHSHNALPIGTWPVVKKVPPVLIGEGQLAETDFAGEVGILIADGVLRGVSVGFRPKAFAALFDENENFIGFDFTESDLLEASIVPVPMHPDALIAAVKAGKVKHTEGHFRKALGTRYDDLLKYAELPSTPDVAVDGDALAVSAIRLGVTEFDLRMDQIQRTLRRSQ